MDLDPQTLQYFFELSPDLFAIVDRDGKFLYLNGQWKKYLGHEVEEMIGRPFLDFVLPEERERTKREMEKYFESKSRKRPIFENRYQSKNGNVYTFQWNSIFDEKTQRFYAVVRDITPYKTINDLKKNLEKTAYQTTKLGMIGQISSEIASEMSDPLFSIGGHAELIEMHVQKPSPKKDYIREQAQQIRQSLKKLEELKKALARLTKNVNSNSGEPFLLYQVIQDLALFIQRQSRLSNIEINYDEVDHEDHIHCHQGELTLLIYQILTACLNPPPSSQRGKVNFHTQKEQGGTTLVITCERIPLSLEDCLREENTPFYNNLTVYKDNDQHVTFKIKLDA